MKRILVKRLNQLPGGNFFKWTDLAKETRIHKAVLLQNSVSWRKMVSFPQASKRHIGYRRRSPVASDRPVWLFTGRDTWQYLQYSGRRERLKTLLCFINILFPTQITLKKTTDKSWFHFISSCWDMLLLREMGNRLHQQTHLASAWPSSHPKRSTKYGVVYSQALTIPHSCRGERQPNKLSRQADNSSTAGVPLLQTRQQQMKKSWEWPRAVLISEWSTGRKWDKIPFVIVFHPAVHPPHSHPHAIKSSPSPSQTPEKLYK